MTYSSYLDRSSVESGFLVVLSPRQRIVDASVYSGNTYQKSFTLGPVQSVTSNGTALTDAGSLGAMGSNKYFYDSASQILYVNVGAAITTQVIVAVYELYFSQGGVSWYRDPLDTASTPAYFEGVVLRVPQVRQSLTDLFFGSLPSQTANFTIANDEAFMNPQFEDTSFYRVPVKIYHWLRELSLENIVLFHQGEVQSVEFSDEDIKFTMLDRIGVLDREYDPSENNPASGSLQFTRISNTTYPALDPQYEGKLFQKFIGEQTGVVLINTDYVTNEPGTGDNRNWRLGPEVDAGLATRYIIVSGDVSNNTGRTFYNTTGLEFIQVGAGFWVTGQDARGVVTLVTPTYFEHTLITAPATGAHSFRFHPRIKRLYIFQNNIFREPFIHRDFTATALSTDATKVDKNSIVFSSTMEVDKSLDTLQPGDVIFCELNTPITETVGGTTLGNASTNLIASIAHCLKNAGVEESEIDETSFAALDSTLTDQIAFSIPKSSLEDLPKVRDVLTDLLTTGLLKLYINSDQKWALKQVGPLGAPDETITDADIVEGSLNYDYEFRDLITDVIVSYAPQEAPFKGGGEPNQSLKVIANNPSAIYLHDGGQVREFTSLHKNESDAQALADRLALLYGERQHRVKLTTKNALRLCDMGQVIRLEREKLPGFQYEEGTTRTRDFAVIEITQSSEGTTVVLDDQKGVEDNAGSW